MGSWSDLSNSLLLAVTNWLLPWVLVKIIFELFFLTFPNGEAASKICFKEATLFNFEKLEFEMFPEFSFLTLPAGETPCLGSFLPLLSEIVLGVSSEGSHLPLGLIFGEFVSSYFLFQT